MRRAHGVSVRPDHKRGPEPLVTAAEIEQLTVPRGTLTSAERNAIQSHVTHTYQFLKRIPWTSYLRQVPEIAYGHHEKLDGSR